MRNWISLLLIGTLAFASCNSDDDLAGITFEQPVWNDNVEFVSTTNTPTVQIDRFVAANNMDTVLTASGLVYVILDPGEAEKQSGSSEVVAWYKGYLTDGVIFDQSTTSPLFSQLSGLIPGWREGMPLLGRGGKMWMLVRPSLGYGNQPPTGTPITSNSVMVFEIEMVDF